MSTLSDRSAPRKTGKAPVRTEVPVDDAPALFAGLVAARESGDTRACVAFMGSLRLLGWSVLPIDSAAAWAKGVAR